MRRFPIPLVLFFLAASAAPAAGQLLPGATQGSSVRTRADLEQLLADYQQALQSPAYSEGVKRAIRVDVAMVQDRLENGDFRTGDRIVLSVQGEPSLPDTVSVQPGPIISLPLFGEIPLGGVLRSEITQHLTRELSRFIRDPVVSANSLMRLEVQGSVGQPGYYYIPAEMLVGDALMAAGGPTPAASTGELTINRGAQTLLEGEALQEAIRLGMTLDQLNLQAGDQIVVPQEPTGGWLGQVGIIAGVVGSVATLVLIFTR